MIQNTLPRFSDMHIPDLPRQLEALLDDSRQQVENLVRQPPPFTWENLMVPLEDIDDRIDKFWSPVSHLNGVLNSEELREAYEACVPLLTAFHSEMGQNRALYEAVRSLADSEVFGQLSEARQQAVRHMLRDFRLSGVALDASKRQRFSDIEQRLSELSTTFANNVLDATDGWEKYIEDEKDLAGLPDTALQQFRQEAQAREKSGYRLSLAIPAYLPVMQYADNRELRREVYEAFTTRASDQGPNAGRWDNSALMVEILQLREEMAGLLGFGNYAELSLQPKMAETPQQVLAFLEELVEAGRDEGERELEEVRAFAADQGQETLEAWDIPYYSEKLRQRDFAISQEQLRPYFPADRVIEGLFAVTGRLFGLHPARGRGRLAPGRALLPGAARGRTRGHLLHGSLRPGEKTRRCLDGGLLRAPAHRRSCAAAGGLPDLQFFPAHR